MSSYEHGSAAWDIGQILTVHESTAGGDPHDCRRVVALLHTRGMPGEVRLAAALEAPCTCQRGQQMNVPSIERTSLRGKERASGLSAAGTDGAPNRG